MTVLTRDSISLRGAGVVSIVQPKKGFRFTLDSLLLADFCRIRPRDRILEAGAGTGIISLVLAKKFPNARFVADEVEPQAYSLLRLNVENNGLADTIVTVDQDIQQLNRSMKTGAFDIIVANPPYTRSGTGRKSPAPERQRARQDEMACLHAWIDLHPLLRNKGKYFLVFPANRAAELLTALRVKKLEPKRLRSVHSSADRESSIVLVESIKGAGTGLEIMPPLIVHGQNGRYTDEMRDIYGMT